MTRTRIAVAVLTVATLMTPRGVTAQTFGYSEGSGPAFWGGLDPGWAACRTGKTQSPVDFTELAPQHPSWGDVSLRYDEKTMGEIVNNGHTIEVETEGNNTLTLGDTVYALKQFHFHTASEHRVAGRGYDMELHWVHASADGSNAVIGVFLRRGESSGALAPIFDNLPNDLETHHHLVDPFNPAAFLPTSTSHYRYVGSLTTPPCTEGVQWFVMTEPVTVSDEQMVRFAERIHFNARPVQRRF